MNPHSGGPPDLRYSGPNYTHDSDSSHQWQASQHHMPPLQYQAGGGGLQQSRNSWDLASYLDTSPAAMSAAAASGHGNRQGSNGGYSGRDIADGSALPLLSEGETKMRTTQTQPKSQQVPNS